MNTDKLLLSPVSNGGEPKSAGLRNGRRVVRKVKQH